MKKVTELTLLLKIMVSATEDSYPGIADTNRTNSVLSLDRKVLFLLIQ